MGGAELILASLSEEADETVLLLRLSEDCDNYMLIPLVSFQHATCLYPWKLHV